METYIVEAGLVDYNSTGETKIVGFDCEGSFPSVKGVLLHKIHVLNTRYLKAKSIYAFI